MQALNAIGNKMGSMGFLMQKKELIGVSRLFSACSQFKINKIDLIL